MKKWIWNFLVIVALGLLIISAVNGNIILAILSLSLALFLKRYNERIKLPGFYRKIFLRQDVDAHPRTNQ